MNDAAYVIEVTCQPIYAMRHHRVAHQASSLSIRGLGVLARRLVGEDPPYLNASQLPVRVVVEATDAHVADALTVQGVSKW